MEKINLYEKRSFGENFNLTFDFLKQNYGAICKPLCYLIPFFLIVAYFQRHEISGSFDYDSSPYSLESFLGTLLSYIGAFIVNIYVACYMVEYVESGNIKVESSKVWARVKSSVAPLIVSGILYTLAVAAGCMLCLVPGIIIAVYWVFYTYAYVAHEPGITDCLTSSYYLVKESWWVTFGYLLLFGIGVMIIQLLFMMPSYLYFVGEMLQIPFLTSEIYQYVSASISNLGTLFVSPVMSIGLGVMYYSLRTEVYGIDVDATIDNLGLGEQDDEQ